jgi:Bifunctional DNA primase/polymerase, N-terminal/Primase C terminal 1 (PriCT-1)
MSYHPAIPPNLQRWLGFYAGSGKPLFPLKRWGKEPAIPREKGGRGFKDATCDLGQLCRWAEEFPGCNWGMPNGEISGTTVTDHDKRHGSDDTEDDLRRLYGDYEPAVQQLTGNGRHDVWPYIPGVRSRADALGAGIDVRSDGAYILVAPSIHPNGRRYCWEVSHDIRDHALTPAPAWMQTLLREGPRVGSDSGTEALRRLTPSEAWTDMLSTPSEKRHDTLIRFSGHLLRRYVDGYLVLAIAQLWNSHLARPEPLSEYEVRRTVESIARAELRRRESKS